MSIDLIKAEIIIRVNISKTCTESQSFLTSNEGNDLVNSVKNNSKYLWQN